MRKFVRLFTALAATGFALSLMSTPALANIPVPQQKTTAEVLFLIHNDTGGCLALRGGGAQLGVPAIKANCSRSAPDQKWFVRAISGAAMQIQNAKSGAGCLAIRGTSTAAGARIIHARCAPIGPDQWWDSTAFSGSLRNTYSGRCMALAGGGAQVGAEALQTRCDRAGDDQHWTFEVL